MSYHTRYSENLVDDRHLLECYGCTACQSAQEADERYYNRHPELWTR